MPVKDTLFGICDDEDEAAKTPAYVDVDVNRQDKWTAIVKNKSEKIISFIAVDNKIEIKRDNGQMENRCDAMLHNDDYIVFIELKDQGKDWIRHAVEDQLVTTINILSNVMTLLPLSINWLLPVTDAIGRLRSVKKNICNVSKTHTA